MRFVPHVLSVCAALIIGSCSVVGHASDENAIDVIQPAIDIARSIQSYEVLIHEKSTELTLTPTETVRDTETHTKIWCDLQRPEFIAIQRTQISEGEKKTWVNDNIFVYADGRLRKNTSRSSSTGQKMSFDTFRSTSRLPYPELLGFGSVPVSLSESKDECLDQMLHMENATVRRSPDGTATIVLRVEVEGVEAIKSFMIDKTTLTPNKVSMKIGDLWTQVCTIRREDVNAMPVPVHIRLSTDQKDPNALSSPPIKHADQWLDLKWKSINQPITFPNHDELLSAKEAEIEQLLEIQKENTQDRR